MQSKKKELTLANSVVSAWLKQAFDDLNNAAILYRSESYSGSCFFSQQAAEKFAKAVLLNMGCQPPYTHNIAQLIKSIENDGVGFPNKPSVEEAALNLTLLFGNVRYPQAGLDAAPCELIGWPQAKMALESAVSIFDVAIFLMPEAIKEAIPGARNRFQSERPDIQNDINSPMRP